MKNVLRLRLSIAEWSDCSVRKTAQTTMIPSHDLVIQADDPQKYPQQTTRFLKGLGWVEKVL